MKVFKFISLFLLFQLYSISCTDKRIDTDHKQTYAIDHLSKDQPFLLLDSVVAGGSFSFIPLELSGDVIIATVNTVFFVDSLIITVDNKLNQILVFSRSGKFLRKIGNYGRGPGEYNQIMDCQYNRYNQTIEVLDITPRLLSFDLTGNMISQGVSALYDYSPGLFYPISENKYALYNSFNHTGKTIMNSINYNFFVVSQQGKELNHSLPFTGKDIEIAQTDKQFFETESGELSFFESFVPLVYRVSEKGLTSAYLLDFEGIDKSIYSDSHFVDDYEKKYRKIVPFLNSIYESDRFILISCAVDRVRKYCVYDKTKGATVGCSEGGYYVYETLLNISGDIMSDGEQCVTVVSPEEIMNIQKIFRNPVNRKQKLSEDLKKLLDVQVSEGSNPVLMFFKLRK